MKENYWHEGKQWRVGWRRNGYIGLTDGKSMVSVLEKELIEEELEKELELESQGGYPFE